MNKNRIYMENKKFKFSLAMYKIDITVNYSERGINKVSKMYNQGERTLVDININENGVETITHTLANKVILERNLLDAKEANKFLFQYIRNELKKGISLE
jgi:hypothetical protein